MTEPEVSMFENGQRPRRAQNVNAAATAAWMSG